jgi:hypothetical protein
VSTGNNGAAVEKPRYPDILSLAQIMQIKYEPPRWAVPGILAQGLTILAGKPKMGKSWMCLGVGLSVAYGGKALGQIQVEQGEVLYLALEDTPETIQERAALINPNLNFPSNFYIHTEWLRMGEGGLKHLSAWLEDHPACRLVLIDTLGRIKPIQTKARSLYDEDYRIGAALKTVADKHKVCLVCLHHLRKAAADDVMDTVSATLGLTGAADAMVVLSRSRGQADAVMHVTGRRVREQELALRFDDQAASWALVGQAEDFKKSKERSDIVKVLNGAPTAMTPTEVSGVLGKKVNAVKYLMWKMSNEGELKAVDGRYSPAVTITANPANPLTLTTLGMENDLHGDALLLRMGHFSSGITSSTVSGTEVTPLTVVTKVSGVSEGTTVSTVSGRAHSGEVCMECGVELKRGWLYLCSECEARQQHRAGPGPEEEYDDA